MSAPQCDVDWGSATPAQRCVLPAGHQDQHVDSSGSWSSVGRLVIGGLEEAREHLELDPRRRLKIKTEVQIESAGRILGRAREYLTKSADYDAWPARVGSLEYFTRALADELERVLEREQEWIRRAAAAEPHGADGK
jgi:hypothetical protein